MRPRRRKASACNGNQQPSLTELIQKKDPCCAWAHPMGRLNRKHSVQCKHCLCCLLFLYNDPVYPFAFCNRLQRPQ
ncbi:hypothetical protein CEF21_16475 [Bacillus sp. FJAT-42376]|nr:hypothetical protein CEF21_16475 [Bacillus sp. FJAT-42376]